MPIYKGLTKIDNIYKGTTTISNIYKGAILVYSSAKWLSYGFTNLYNSLIPSTIESRNVLDKLKITKVYGDSVVENQLVQNGNFADTSNWSAFGGLLSVNGNVGTLTINSSGSANRLQQDIYPIQNHKYIIMFDVKANVVSKGFIHFGNDYTNIPYDIATSWKTISYVIAPTSIANPFRLYINYGGSYLSNNDEVDLRNVNIFDLTQMFPFDTPTSLSDIRVQALLNRGYIEYNTGEIKSVDISEFSTTKADTTALDTLSFKAQLSGVNTSKDTMEITNTDVIFTKNNAYVDLGTLTWSKKSNNRFVSGNELQNIIKTWTDYQGIPNLMCGKYSLTTPANIEGSSPNDKSITMSGNGISVVIYDSAYASEDASAFKTAMSGVLLQYQLATPQTITIPRKHFRIVDLGNLIYFITNSTTGIVGTIGLQNSIKANTTKMYCSKFINGNVYSSNECIFVESNSAVDIRSSAFIGKTAIQVKTLLSGTYLFYETNSEVADIEDMIKVEAGGTITSDSNVLFNVDTVIKCK